MQPASIAEGAAEKQPVPVPAAPVPVIVKPAPPRSLKSRLGRGFWIGTGVTGGLGITAAILGGLAYGESSTLAQTQYKTSADFMAEQGKVRGLAIASDMTLGCAVAAGLVTLSVTLCRKPYREK